MKPSDKAAFTWTEVLVGLVVIASLYFFVFSILVPGTLNRCGKNGPTISLSNMKQLHIATRQMAMDNAQTLQAGWPGDMGGSFSNWSRALAEGGYFTTHDLRKLFSAPGRIIRSDEPHTLAASAALVYAVKETSPTNTVFLTTANFTNTPTGGVKPLANAKPYGKKGFVVFRKGGDGAILMARQAGDTNLIGGFVPLLK